MRRSLSFNAVTSPYAAGIADASCVHPAAGDRDAGTVSPYSEIMPLIFEVAPDATTVGYMYNPAEANSVVITEIMSSRLAEELGIDLVIQTISNSSEVPSGCRSASFQRCRGVLHRYR